MTACLLLRADALPGLQPMDGQPSRLWLGDTQKHLLDFRSTYPGTSEDKRGKARRGYIYFYLLEVNTKMPRLCRITVPLMLMKVKWFVPQPMH